MASPTSGFGWNTAETATKNIAIPAITFADNYTRDTTQKGNPGEMFLRGTTQPTGQNEIVKISTSVIKDVYKDNIQKIAPAAMYAIHDGYSTVIQLYETYRHYFSGEETTAGPGYVDFPVGFRGVFTYPNVSFITPDILLELKRRLDAFFYGDGDDISSSRMNQIMRGNLLPPGIVS